MGTRKSLLLHLLETPWQQSSPVRAFERTRPLALEMGRPFVTKGPSAGPAASTAHQHLFIKVVIPSFPLLAPCPGSALQLASRLPAVTTNRLTFQLVAQRLAWRHREEGDSAGMGGRAPSGSLLFPSVLVSSSSLPPFAPVPALWQYDRPLQDENSKVSHSHP